MKKRIYIESVYQLCTIISLVLLLIISVKAQNVQHQTNTVDQAFRSDLRVDPSTLNMSIKIPLRAYSGRAGNSLSVALFYSSKLWRMDYGGYYQEGACCAPRFDANPQGLPSDDHYTWVTPNYAADTGAGWTSSLDFPKIVVTGTPEWYDYNGDPCEECPLNQAFFVKRFRLRMSDGSTHEFRVNDNVYVNPGPLTYPISYYSVDGSHIHYVQETEQQATLYLSDGSRYLMGNQQAYIDRNGNKMTYANGAWTDTMGRTISLPSLYNRTSPADVTYTVPSLNNSSNYIFRWRYLKNEATGETVLSDPNQQLYVLGDRFVYGPGVYGPTLFHSEGGSRVIPPGTFNPVVLAEIELPNGSKYQFRYNIYGEIDKVIYPTGGYERYRYDVITGIDPVNEPYAQTNRGIVERWVSPSGNGADEQHWQYSAGPIIGSYKVTTTAPDGTRTERYLQQGRGPGVVKYGFDDSRAGMTLEERSYSSTNQIMSRTLYEYAQSGPQTGGYNTATRDPRATKTISITFEGNSPQALAVMTENEYDSNSDPEYFAYLNIKRTKQYHYVALDLNTAQNSSIQTIAAYFTSDKLARISETDYLYSPDYKARNITELATEQRVLKPDGTVVAKSQIFYDEPSYAPISYGVTLSSWVDPGPNTKRGQATTTRSYYDLINNLYIEAHAQTDQFGNVVKAWDASGNPNRFTETEYSPTYFYAYPTKVKTPAPSATGQYGTTQGSEVTTNYDFNTGLALSITNLNDLTDPSDDQTTTTEYNDPLLRPTRVIPPAGGGITETIYNDTPGNLWVKTRTQIDGSNWGEATTFMDGLGRTYKAQVKDSQGDVFTETEYDVMGRVKRVTNPYRLGETKYWTMTNYDEAGRVKEVFSPTQDGQTPESKVSTEYGISTVPNFVGTYTIGTDQAGKKGRSITNALGELIRVDEATGNNLLGDIASPNQPTFYTYSPHGEMVKVQQGNQYRYFLYDSLGRLLRVRQPEQDVNPDLNWNDPVTGNNQWTAGFTYDSNGNMLTATDAKGVVITNAYDNLNRVVTRSYTLPQTTDPKKITFATPNVTYKYDGAGAVVPFAKGKLTEVSNGISTTKYTSFDNLGRLLSSEQVTDGQVYRSKYKYNLSGMVEETYPSGRVVKQINDSTGHLMRVFGRAANGPEQTYVNEIKRAADGRISQLRTGNGLWENAKFNSRLQITELALGTSATDTSLWKLNYEYGLLNPDGSVDQAKNSGNIARQTLTYQGLASPFVQTFKYDSLDRLKEAKETTNGSQNWIQTFDYDRYGNRTSFSQTVGNQQLAINNQTLPSVDPLTNRFTTGQGYTYDFNGNLILDAQNRNFKFNGDNKQVEVTDSANNQIGQYFYDSDGRRVKKISSSETTIFVYDAMGKLVEEYSNQQSPTPTTSYVVTDTLQSVRAVTNAQGQVVSRRDFMPFGEELYAGTPNRTESLKYSQSGQDNVRKRFTGYEKDQETGLDFAEARYYNNQHGRFTAVDPLLSSGKSSNPQTFNRYIYVLNQPLIATDPSGMQVATKPDIGKFDVDVSEGPKMVGQKWITMTKNYGSYGSITDSMSVPVYDTDQAPYWSPQIQAFQDYQANYNSFGNSSVRGWLKGYGNFVIGTANFALDAAEGPGATLNPFRSRFPTLQYDNTTEAVAGWTSNIFHGFAFSSIAPMATASGGIRSAEAFSTLAGFGSDADVVANSANLIPKKGWYDVVVHGTEDGLNFTINKQVTTPSELYGLMLKDGYNPGTKIRLISCYSGSVPNGAAQQLSNLARARVVAPAHEVAVPGAGSMFPAHRPIVFGGKWFNIFDPK